MTTTLDVPEVTGSGLVLQARYATALPRLHEPWRPAGAPDPQLVVLNEPLATALGLDVEALRSADGVAVLGSAAVPAGSRPVAMAYAGHQFGHLSPRLGDGRALLLGEVEAPDGTVHDVHLKGSGRTPFARGGDGRGTLSSMLREYLVSEAMHALGVPTTRSLAVASAGAVVHREEGHVPAGVLTRTAASHLRVGTFQYAALLEGQHGEEGLLEELSDHAIARHHPDLAGDDPGRHLALLGRVVEAQASLVARWMLLGFIHGVMNTDNTTISGETIDYGPLAFMDRHAPDTVYSSIDRGGRYAYGNQPSIAHWNLVRLAEAMLPLFGEDREAAAAAVNEVLRAFPSTYRARWTEGLRTKLGLVEARDGDGKLGDRLFDWMHAAGADHTGTFRALAASLRGEDGPLDALAAVEPARVWLEDWRARLTEEGRDPVAVADGMDAVNPVYVPRVHRLEEALAAAVDGDLGHFEALLAAVTDPYVARPERARYAEPAPASFTAAYRTFCGT